MSRAAGLVGAVRLLGAAVTACAVVTVAASHATSAVEPERLASPMVNVETRLICDDDRGISGAAHGWGADGGPAACQLRAVLPPDLLPVPWLLDPAYPVPTADATVLHLFVSSGVCDGVMRPTVQDVTPLVVDDVDTVTITLAVPQTSLYGACLGGGFPAILSLDRPLGTRALLDGSFVPPRPPVVPSVERFHPSPAP